MMLEQNCECCCRRTAHTSKAVHHNDTVIHILGKVQDALNMIPCRRTRISISVDILKVHEQAIDRVKSRIRRHKLPVARIKKTDPMRCIAPLYQAGRPILAFHKYSKHVLTINGKRGDVNPPSSCNYRIAGMRDLHCVCCGNCQTLFCHS